jgi:Domain of unknown function (DUF222)
MRPYPLRDPGDDGQEPDCWLPDTEPAQQGLFLCLPTGSLDTGRFAQSGPAAEMAPDPLLATVIDTVAGEDGQGLAGLSDDQLVGVIAAVRRLESRATWYLMAAVGEFAARRADEPAVAEFAADQLACELHLTGASAAAQMDYAATVASRLPATCAALHAGTIHPVHVRIIEDETRILSAADAARADAQLAQAAGSLTFGKLRAAAAGLSRPPTQPRRWPLARAAVKSGGCLGLAFALVLFAANVLDPHGLGNPNHPWSSLCLVVALGLVLTALGIFGTGVATSVEQRRSRRQLPPRPEAGGHALEAGQSSGTGHGPALPPDRPDQTRADQTRAGIRSDRSRSGWPYSPGRGARKPRGVRPVPEAG